MNLKTLAVLIALSLPLAGCGNKGPLVLPQKPVPVEESMPLEAPAEPTTETADTTDTTATEAGVDVDVDPAAVDGDATGGDDTVGDDTDADAEPDVPPAEPPPTPAG